MSETLHDLKFDLFHFFPGENSAYYKAFVKDVDESKKEVFVRFERDWQPRSRFPFDRVRLVPSPDKVSKEPFKEGQEIEVFSRASDQESCGWWRAIIKVRNQTTLKRTVYWYTHYTVTVRLSVKN